MPSVRHEPVEHDAFCCIPTCRAVPHPASPHPMCGTHIKEMYVFGQSLVDDRWTEAVREAVEATRPVPVIPPTNDTAGYVYFVQIRGLIKIGYTTYPRARFKSLRPDRVLAVIPGTLTDEKRCHAAFAHLLAERREYFRPEADLLAFIEEMRLRSVA